MGSDGLRARADHCLMPKSELTAFIVKILLGLLIVEAVATIVFELAGIKHNTPVWIVSVISGGLMLVLRAAYKEKK
jgi:uncharacterized integral membrane protein